MTSNNGCLHSASDGHSFHSSHAPHSHFSSPSSKRKLLFVMSFTGVFFAVELIGGFLSGSLALLADSAHMFIDFSALLLSTLAAHLTETPPSARHTFGLKRLEALAAQFNALLLFLSAFFILREAIDRLLQPHSLIIEVQIMLPITLIGLALNLLGLYVLHDKGHGHENMNVRGAFLHVLSDTLGSIGALLAALFIWLFNLTILDTIISLFIVSLILVGAVNLIWNSISILIESTPRHLDLAEIKTELEAIKGVIQVSDLHAWALTQSYLLATAHLAIASSADFYSIQQAARSILKRHGFQHITIQIDLDTECEEGKNCYPSHPLLSP